MNINDQEVPAVTPDLATLVNCLSFFNIALVQINSYQKTFYK